jgi:hypothetical protein
LPYPLDAKGAFFHGTLHSGSVSEVMDGRVYLLSWNIWLRPVKNPPFIRAGCDAISAADAPVVINHNDTVRFLPSGVDRAHLYTRRVLTLLALNRQIDKSFFWNEIRAVVMFGVFKIDQVSSLESENPDPLKLRVVS